MWLSILPQNVLNTHMRWWYLLLLKESNSNYVCDHGSMDVLKYQSSGSRKTTFAQNKWVLLLPHGPAILDSMCTIYQLFAMIRPDLFCNLASLSHSNHKEVIPLWIIIYIMLRNSFPQGAEDFVTYVQGIWLTIHDFINCWPKEIIIWHLDILGFAKCRCLWGTFLS